MKFGDEQNFIQFESCEPLPTGTLLQEDMAFDIEVAAWGFRGADGQVWFERSALLTFLSELQILEQRRQGTATLTDYSYSSAFPSFRVSIFSTDVLGHMAVAAELRHWCEIGRVMQNVGVAIAFEFEPSLLPSIVRDFESLLAYH